MYDHFASEATGWSKRKEPHEHFAKGNDFESKAQRRVSSAAYALLDAAPVPPAAELSVYLGKRLPDSERDALVEESKWWKLPAWISLQDARGKQMLCWKGHPLSPADVTSWVECYICGLKPIPHDSPMLWCETCRNWCVCATCASSPRMPMLQDDLLFHGCDDPCLIEWGTSKHASNGTVILCPGGNYEFLCPNEVLPASMWLADHSIFAVILRYRLLPKYQLDDALDDLAAAIAHVRNTRSGRVVAMGFSAGAHLIASSAVREAAAQKRDLMLDGQILVYPAIDGSDWLHWRTCGWFDKERCLPGAQSLVNRQDALLGGSGFAAPPTFLVSSTADTTCPPTEHGDPYARALTAANVSHTHIRRDLGDHGFGLGKLWADDCAKWLTTLMQASGHDGLS